MNDDTAEPLDPIARLTILSAGVRHAVVTEAVVDAPFDEVWALLTDFEGGFARVEPDMAEVRVVRRDGPHVELVARSRYGMRARLVGVVRPGLCWLQSRRLLVAMAATPAGPGRTRVALTGGVRVPARPALVPIGVRHEARRALRRLAAELDRPARSRDRRRTGTEHGPQHDR